jgi:hypothetical protein
MEVQVTHDRASSFEVGCNVSGISFRVACVGPFLCGWLE